MSDAPDVPAQTENIIWKRLQTTTEEMFDTLRQFAFSLVIREQNDCSSILTNRDGNAIAMSRGGTPALSGCGSRTVRLVFENHFPPESLNEGDLIITNDPWIGGGHVFDFVAISPVFYKGELIGTATSVGHVQDVGGLVGALSTKASEVYEEGAAIPPTKLYDAGERNDAVASIIRNNVRVPDKVLGDIESLQSANMIGAQRMRKLADDFGVDVFTSVGENLLDRSEDALREYLSGLDDGTYSRSLTVPLLTEPDTEITIDTDVTIDGDSLILDFSGTSDQINNGVNAPITSTRAQIWYIVKCMALPDTDISDGFFRPVDIRAPEGSIVNCTRPYPTAMRTITTWPTIWCVIQALGQAIPEKLMAEGAGMTVANFSGTDLDGEDFIKTIFTTFPSSGMATKDGLSPNFFPTNLRNEPIEITEQYTPLRLESQNQIPDTEGPGRHRSGFAQEHVFRNVSEEPIDAVLSLMSQHRAPSGIEGGLDGNRRKAWHLESGEKITRSGSTTIEPGDGLRIEAASGGGFGDPTERDEELVEKDIRDGLLSRERAKEIYGYER